MTGGGRGIGAATAVALAIEGADVAINDLEPHADIEPVLQEIAELGTQVVFVGGDVTNMADCRQLIERTLDRFGRIDVLVNNAGKGQRQRFDEISEQDFDHILALHLKAPFFLAQLAAPHMRSQGWGRIVNIGSEQAYTGHPLLAHYTAAKAGLLTLTRSLARALAPTITVNSVAPGPTATDRFKAGPEYVDDVLQEIPLRRWGLPHDVARSVVFLVSPDGDNYTGQTLDPNGGTVMP